MADVQPLTLGNEPANVVVAIKELHNLRIPFYVNNVIIIATIIAGMVAIALTANGVPFSSFGHYRIFLVPAFSLVMMAFSYFSWARNLRRNTLTLAQALAVFLLIIMFVFAIWAIVDVAYYCPSSGALPLYCTNGITGDVLTGYWIYAVSLWIVTLDWIAYLIIVIIARRTVRRLFNPVTGLEQQSLFELLYRNGEFPTDFVTAIGAKRE